MHRRPLRLWLTWIALWAFALAALAPTVSRALAASGGGGGTWIEVCTVAGERWVHVDDEPGGGDTQPASGLDHCALCPLMGDRLAPTPASLALPTVRPPFIAAPEPRARPVPARVWLAAAPRGPPCAPALSLAA